MRRLHDGAAVAALESTALTPPPRPGELPDGPTAELRDAMARFASGDTHRAARREVEAAIASIDIDLLTREVRERTRRAASVVPPIDALADIGFVVPTQALLATVGVDADDNDARTTDVRLVVGVIGRGEPVGPSVEAAVRRLMACFAGYPHGPIAAISMLYQNHDATAALFGSVLLARSTDIPRPNALARTIRVATADTVLPDDAGTMLPGQLVAAGETVEVSLDGDGIEFGAGIHRCPGEALAVAIVDAMVWVLDDLDCAVDADAIILGADGRASALPLRLSTGSDQDPDQDPDQDLISS